MNTEYSKYYYRDFDEDGMPFSYPVNPVHTILSLKASNEAILKAQKMLAVWWTGIYANDFDVVKLYRLGDRYNIDILTINFIPQIFDELREIDGVTDISYAVYDTAHGRMITNNDSMGRAIARVFKLNVGIEVDDEADMFPEKAELSLLDLNDVI